MFTYLERVREVEGLLLPVVLAEYTEGVLWRGASRPSQSYSGGGRAAAVVEAAAADSEAAAVVVVRAGERGAPAAAEAPVGYEQKNSISPVYAEIARILQNGSNTKT